MGDNWLITVEGVWRWSEELAECMCAATQQWSDGGRSFYYYWRGGWGEYVGKDGCEAPHAYYGGSCDVLHTICGTQLTRRRTADVLPSLDGGPLLVRGEWQENNGVEV